MTDQATSTLADVTSGRRAARPRWGRRVCVALLGILVLLGASGVFGVHSRTLTRAGNGYRLTLTYPQTARAGLDVPWRAHIHADGGFTDDLTLAISSDYFRMFETQGFYPDADSSTNDGGFVYLTFAKPETGHDFELEYDAYIQPSAQLGKTGTIMLIVKDQTELRANFKTWLVP